MKSLKNHLSLLLALIAILFSFEVWLIFGKVMLKYQQQIVGDTSIIVVSNKEIKELDNPVVQTITRMDISKFVNRLNFASLGIDKNKFQESLPYFYKVKLKRLLSDYELKKFSNDLRKLSFVKRVENFSAVQSKIYNLLFLLDKISKIFMYLILFISFLLIIKQMEVLKLEHQEAMYIMELFGAPFWLRSVKLLKLAFIDSILSIIIVGGMFIYFINSDYYLDFLMQLGIHIDIDIFTNILTMLGISLFISLVATLVVINSKKSDY